jgi:hypothetical protein
MHASTDLDAAVSGRRFRVVFVCCVAASRCVPFLWIQILF